MGSPLYLLVVRLTSQLSLVSFFVIQLSKAEMSNRTWRSISSKNLLRALAFILHLHFNTQHPSQEVTDGISAKTRKFSARCPRRWIFPKWLHNGRPKYDLERVDGNMVVFVDRICRFKYSNEYCFGDFGLIFNTKK